SLSSSLLTSVSPSPSMGTVSSLGSMSASTSVSAGLGSTTSVEEVFRSSKHAILSLDRMRSFYQGGQLCDVTLVAGGRRFPSHRLVLSAASDYFAAMFTSGLAEARQDEVSLPHVDPESLETLLHYCYTGELEVRESSVECLLSTAHQLLLNEVVSVCCNFLASQLHPTNCIGIQLFADSQGCSTLQKAAQQYTAQHFSEVCGQQEFVQLQLPELLQLLRSDDLNVASEETIVQAVRAWLEHNLEDRRQFCSKVLGQVRLPLLNPQYLSETIESCPLFRDDLRCQQLLLEALKHHLKVPLPLDASEEVLMRARPRKSTVGLLYLVGGMDSTKLPVEVLQFNYRANEWTVQAGSGCNTRRLQCGGGVVGGRLHIVGGR
ncbi:BTB/POZ domain, partial [Trinorchestia longiramus]